MSDRADMTAKPPVMSRVNAGLRRVPPWTLYVVAFLWAGWLFFLGATGGLGVEPIEALEHRYGELALQLVVAGLAVTPLRQLTGLNLMPFRRAIGVVTFGFVLAHFLVWAVLDVQRLSLIWADILERPYVTIGMAGLVLLIPLALTSNNWAVRRLGGLRWRKLHRLVYPAALLGAVHYVWLAKGFQVEPLVYLGLIVGLLALRIRRPRARGAR
jgi:sulfoxide reductase heme-binding subunit YedZ